MATPCCVPRNVSRCDCLNNLTTFPFVREAMAAGNLSLHGWYLNIFEGALEVWNPDTETFERLS